MRLAAALLVLALLPATALARGPGYGSPDGGYYQATDGSMEHGPTHTRETADGRVTADCRDGTFSYSHHHQGTCSGHGGVEKWE